LTDLAHEMTGEKKKRGRKNKRHAGEAKKGKKGGKFREM